MVFHCPHAIVTWTGGNLCMSGISAIRCIKTVQKQRVQGLDYTVIPPWTTVLEVLHNPIVCGWSHVLVPTMGSLSWAGSPGVWNETWDNPDAVVSWTGAVVFTVPCFQVVCAPIVCTHSVHAPLCLMIAAPSGKAKKARLCTLHWFPMTNTCKTPQEDRPHVHSSAVSRTWPS